MAISSTLVHSPDGNNSHSSSSSKAGNDSNAFWPPEILIDLISHCIRPHTKFFLLFFSLSFFSHSEREDWAQASKKGTHLEQRLKQKHQKTLHASCFSNAFPKNSPIVQRAGGGVRKHPAATLSNTPCWWSRIFCVVNAVVRNKRRENPLQMFVLQYFLFFSR